jgi:hypothetical protein
MKAYFDTSTAHVARLHLHAGELNGVYTTPDISSSKYSSEKLKQLVGII